MSFFEAAGPDDDTAIDAEPVDTVPLRAPARSFTRGSNVRAALTVVRDRHGDDGVRRVREAAPAWLRDDLGVELKPGALVWVPTLAQGELLATIDACFGRGDLSSLVDVGSAMARIDLPGIAKPVARFLSPGVFVEMAVKVWRVYNTHGTWEVLHTPRTVRASLFDRPEAHAAFCTATLGWMKGALEFCGAFDVVADEQRCAARGDPCCSFHVSWTERGDMNRRPRPPT